MTRRQRTWNEAEEGELKTWVRSHAAMRERAQEHAPVVPSPASMQPRAFSVS